MLSRKASPQLYVIKGGIYSLSGKNLRDLLHAVLLKSVPFRFCAKGMSMYPFIQNGDIITIYPRNDVTLHTGEVIAFCHPVTEKLVIHRIIKKQRDRIIAKGDNNPEPDGMIPLQNIFGHVTRVERNGKAVFFGNRLQKILAAYISRRNLSQRKYYRFVQRYVRLKNRRKI